MLERLKPVLYLSALALGFLTLWAVASRRSAEATTEHRWLPASPDRQVQISKLLDNANAEPDERADPAPDASADACPAK